MRQCTPSSFSKTWAPTVALLAIVVGSYPAQSQSSDAPQNASGQQEAQKTTELDGQIAKTIDEIKRNFAIRKTAEPSAAANEKRPPKSAEELAKEAAEFALNPQHALSFYSMVLVQVDAKIVASAGQATNSVKTDADEARVDKQVGANSSNSGSTSLTSHGSVPAILGFAVENGALEQSASGTTITFRGRPVQIVQMFQKTPFYDAYAQIETNGTLSLLNRFSFALAFDTTRGISSGTFTGSANQVSNFSTTVDIWNHRDPRDKRYKPRWDRLRDGIARQMALSMYQVFNALSSDAVHPSVKKWIDDTASALAPLLVAGKDDEMTAELKGRIKTFPTISDKLPGTDATLKQFAEATNAMETARQHIFDFVGTSPILTFVYTDNVAAKASTTQTQLPDNSNFKFIFEKGLGRGGSFTSNASATIFNSKPKGIVANQIRDLQASFQLDMPVNTSFPKIGNVVATLSGKYEHIPSDSLVGMVSGITPITSDAALRGNLEIGQAKITFPVKGSGVSIPLSVTWANRTELIKEHEVRGNIGITFDLDTIIAKLKP